MDKKPQISSDLGPDLFPWTQGKLGAELGQRPGQQGQSPLHTVITTSSGLPTEPAFVS